MSDKFIFYSKSADAKPGRGTGETIINDIYEELSKIKDWRKSCNLDAGLQLKGIMPSKVQLRTCTLKQGGSDSGCKSIRFTTFGSRIVPDR
jgi:hypothetical protein